MDVGEGSLWLISNPGLFYIFFYFKIFVILEFTKRSSTTPRYATFKISPFKPALTLRIVINCRTGFSLQI